jgi:Putative beta-lactamase-inhibitor-like, PepSY-like
MKTNQKNRIINVLLILSAILFFASCKKDNAVPSSANTSAVAASQAISVGVSSTTNDSIYVIGTCASNHHLDSIAFAGLPANITNYLNTNYAGYTFQKAYTDKDISGNIAGYVVIIQFNGNPVGLRFDASGNFVKVLEQREGRDLTGRGWHEGGRFGDRDGMHRDTVALSALPASVTSYFSTNYPQDTLVRAYQNVDSGYVVFSTDNGAYATVFSSTGAFISRVQLQDHESRVMPLNLAALPSAIQTYLSSTYPGYVFNQAFSYSANGTLLGYVVCIDASGTKYAIEFDASGTFVKAITLP